MSGHAAEHFLEADPAEHSRLRGRVRPQAPAKTLSIFVSSFIGKTNMKTFSSVWG